MADNKKFGGHWIRTRASWCEGTICDSVAEILDDRCLGILALGNGIGQNGIGQSGIRLNGIWM